MSFYNLSCSYLNLFLWYWFSIIMRVSAAVLPFSWFLFYFWLWVKRVNLSCDCVFTLVLMSFRSVLYILGKLCGVWLFDLLILFFPSLSLEWWSNDLYGWYICNLSHANCIIQFTIAPSQRHIHHQMHCSPVPHSSPPIIIAIIQLIVSQYPNRGLCEHTAT